MEPAVPQGIAKSLSEAMELYQEYRAKGMDQETAINVLEGALRGLWPVPDAPVRFAYECELCDDTGWLRVTYMHRHFGLTAGVKLCSCRKGKAMLAAQERHKGKREKESGHKFYPTGRTFDESGT